MKTQEQIFLDATVKATKQRRIFSKEIKTDISALSKMCIDIDMFNKDVKILIKEKGTKKTDLDFQFYVVNVLYIEFGNKIWLNENIAKKECKNELYRVEFICNNTDTVIGIEGKIIKILNKNKKHLKQKKNNSIKKP